MGAGVTLGRILLLLLIAASVLLLVVPDREQPPSPPDPIPEKELPEPPRSPARTEKTALETARARNPATVRGRVVEAGSGRQLPGVRVRWGEAGEETTDGEGRFSAEVNGSPVRFRISAPGYVATERRESRLAAGSCVDRTYELGRGGDVSGIVVDAYGVPVAGAYLGETWPIVSKTMFPGRVPPRAGVFETGPDGRFHVGISANGAARVFAVLPGRSTGVSGPFEVRRGQVVRDVVVRLAPPCSATVRIRTEQGHSPERVEVLFRSETGDPWAPLPGLPVTFGENPLRLGPESSLSGFLDRPFEVWFCAEGWKPVMFESRYVLPSLGLATRQLEVVLQRGLTISGTVLDAEGKPFPRATIHVNRGRAHLRKRIPFACIHAHTDAEGRFVAGGLEPGEHYLHAIAYLAGRTVQMEVKGAVQAGAEGIDFREE